MRCCPECFEDPFLREFVFDVALTTGHCVCCGADGVRVIEPVALADYFEPILALYAADTSAAALPLPSILRRDWGFFRTVRDEAALALLAEMFPRMEDIGARFVGKAGGDASVLADWDAFRDELRYENRFFPSMRFTQEVEGELFEHLTAPEADVPRALFRARICDSPTQYSLMEMGLPPRDRALSGRANPRGIPYLYVASDVVTAIHELRPQPGELICVAEFSVSEALALADLRNPRRTVSPFEFEEDELPRFYRHIPYLSRLGDELSRPVLPRSADLEYLPSQYLCEFLKHCGFDGLIYRSAMGPGTNYALFTEHKVRASSLASYRVTKTHVIFQPEGTT